MKTIEINASAGIDIRQIDDDNYCVVVDDFLKEPEALIRFACDNVDAFEQQEIGYRFRWSYSNKLKLRILLSLI